MDLLQKAKATKKTITKKVVDEEPMFEEEEEEQEQTITPTKIVKTIPQKKEEKYEIQTVNTTNQLPMSLEQKKLKIQQDIDLIKFMVDSILDKEQDYHKGHIKRSGCCKLALAFDISYEVLSIELEKEYDEKGKLKDIHAHAKAKAIRPNGSYVIATGDKSKSEFWSDKKQSWGSYNLHNLRQTAATKACNRAILNAIPFGMVSSDEISNQDDDFDF